MNNGSNPLSCWAMVRRLSRVLLTFVTLLFALSAQAGWDKPTYPVFFIHGIASNAEGAWGDFVSKASDPGNKWQYGGKFGHMPYFGYPTSLLSRARVRKHDS